MVKGKIVRGFYKGTCLAVTVKKNAPNDFFIQQGIESLNQGYASGMTKNDSVRMYCAQLNTIEKTLTDHYGAVSVTVIEPIAFVETVIHKLHRKVLKE